MILRHLADIATHRLTSLAGVVGGIPGAIGSRLALNLLDYWRHEDPLLANPAEVARWRAEVNEAAQKLAALEQRLHQLEKKS